MSADLKQKARVALGAMPLPNHPRQLYPALHAVAQSIAYPEPYSAAVGEVFRQVCEACCIRYGSQHMAEQLIAQFQDGRLGDAIERLKASRT